jgi:hypothetical protein
VAGQNAAVRAIAVDWSGRTANPGPAIWLAEARAGQIRRLEGGRDRAELTDHLLSEAERDPELVVGLDFAFSFPAWFVEQHATTAFEFWDVVRSQGERWLGECLTPFWRTRGVEQLPEERAYRRTERDLRVGAIRPTSVFKLVGASQVGPGSIRGMPFLARLRESGFRVWPFEDAAPPFLVEIWPRLLTEAVVKSRRADRLQYLVARTPELPDPLRGVAASGDDMFDAAVSAAVMWRHLEQLLHLRREVEYELEGRIWSPGSVGASD